MNTTATRVQLQTTVGVDIGGTKISAALVKPQETDTEKLMSHFQEASTPDELPAFLDTLEKHIKTLQAQQPVATVGISTAGVVDTVQGKIIGSTGNLPAVQGPLELKRILEERVNLPVHVENDANAAAYGEYRVGAGKGYQNVVAVTLGTGVGTGLIINGKMIQGSHFSAGEGGHMAIGHYQERQCTCGRWDCWEIYASGTGLRETALQMLNNVSASDREPFLKGGITLEELTTHEVIDAWQEGSLLAKEMMDQWHFHISLGIRNIINLLDPDIIVVGGGMAQFVNFDYLTRITKVQSMPAEIRLVPASLGNNAGIMGAACLAFDALNPA